MKVVIAGVMYSPNLGDGLIAECLSTALYNVRPDMTVSWLDLAGRSKFSEPQGGARTLVLDGLSRMPQPVSQRIATGLVRRQIATRLAPRCDTVLRGADALIIGGGQLFADANLNFPLKLAHVVACAERMMIPIAIHGVGVSKRWSPRGRSLMGRVLKSPNLRFISVRDSASAENLAQHYLDLKFVPPHRIAVFPDPGLCADALAETPTLNLDKTRQIGVGVIHPAALSTHSDVGAASHKREMARSFAALAQSLVSVGAEVHFFTNGAGEDEEMLAYLKSKVPLTRAITFEHRFSNPLELTRFVGRMHAIASHRLHACIAAHAFSKTAVGFQWDKKIDAYFAQAGQSDHVFQNLSDRRSLVMALMQDLSPEANATLDALRPLVQEGARALLRSVPKPFHAPAVA